MVSDPGRHRGRALLPTSAGQLTLHAQSVLLLVVEGVLIRLLLSSRRGAQEAGDAGRLKEQQTKGLEGARARTLPAPAPSVTEHTTRAFESIYGERTSK